MGGAQLAGADVGHFGLIIGPAIAGVGALAPDIDHPNSWISSRIPLTIAAAGLMLLLTPLAFTFGARSNNAASSLWASMSRWNGDMIKWGMLALGVGILMLTISFLVRRAAQHRGATHSLVLASAAMIVTFALALLAGLGPWLGLMFGLGWLSHLAADAITPHGLPSLLWPLPAREGKGSMRWFGLLLIPLVFVGMFGWYQAFAGGLFGTTQPVEGSSRQTAAGDVSLARQRLREASPEIEEALVSPDSPEVSDVEGKTTYKWEYVRQTDSGSASMKTIAITLDGSGRMVGASQE